MNFDFCPICLWNQSTDRYLYLESSLSCLVNISWHPQDNSFWKSLALGDTECMIFLVRDRWVNGDGESAEKFKNKPWKKNSYLLEGSIWDSINGYIIFAESFLSYIPVGSSLIFLIFFSWECHSSEEWANATAEGVYFKKYLQNRTCWQWMKTTAGQQPVKGTTLPYTSGNEVRAK